MRRSKEPAFASGSKSGSRFFVTDGLDFAQVTNKHAKELYAGEIHFFLAKFLPGIEIN
jgi:hypothetical protein